MLIADVAQTEEHRGATPERPVRSGSSAFTGPWCNGSTASSNLAGPGSNPGGSAQTIVAGRSGSVIWETAADDQRRRGSTPRPDRTPRPRRSHRCCGPATLPLSTPNRQVAGSSPARSTACSGSSVVEQFGRAHHDRSSSPSYHRRGPESDGSRVERPAQAGRSAVRVAPGPRRRSSAHSVLRHHDRSFDLRKEGHDVLLQLVRDADRFRTSARRATRRSQAATCPASTAARSSASSSRTRRPQLRRREPRIRLQIADCVNEITSGSRSTRPSHARTRSSRSTRCSARSSASATALAAEAELYCAPRARRNPTNHERRCADVLPEASRHAPDAAVGAAARARLPNSAGGYAWAVDDWTRLRRFLSSARRAARYYASEWTLTRENAAGGRARAVREDGPRAVAEIVAVSERAGRRRTTRRCSRSRWRRASATWRRGRRRSRRCRRCAARARTCSSSRRSSRASAAGAARCGARSAAGTPARRSDALAYQAVKYRQRAGVTHRDLLRLAHPAAPRRRRQPDARGLGRARSPVRVDRPRRRDGRPAAARRGLRARAGGGDAGARRRRSSASTGLPREALQPEHLTSPEVWEALLEDMPMTALIRNLATMTRVGVLAPGSDGTATAVAQLGDAERIRRARVHPIALLAALRTYAAGRGARGRQRVDAGARGRRRARRRVLHGVRQRRAGGQAAAARARRVRLDDRRLGRRRAGPDAARRLGGARARDGGDRGAVRDRRLLRRQARLEDARDAPAGLRSRTASRRSRSRRGSGWTTP